MDYRPRQPHRQSKRGGFPFSLAPSDLAFMAFGANHRLGTPPRPSTLAIALLHAVSRIWDVEYAISERQFLFALHLGLDAVPAALGRKA